jgi:hypothetical protein
MNYETKEVAYELLLFILCSHEFDMVICSSYWLQTIFWLY